MGHATETPSFTQLCAPQGAVAACGGYSCPRNKGGLEQLRAGCLLTHGPCKCSGDWGPHQSRRNHPTSSVRVGGPPCTRAP